MQITPHIFEDYCSETSQSFVVYYDDLAFSDFIFEYPKLLNQYFSKSGIQEVVLMNLTTAPLSGIVWHPDFGFFGSIEFIQIDPHISTVCSMLSKIFLFVLNLLITCMVVYRPSC